jgi:hypothetical protein
MSLTSPMKIELVYSTSPDVLKPNAQVQATLIQMIKTEAVERIARGERLNFVLSVAGLFTIEVAPGGGALPLPRPSGQVELVVRRKDAKTSSSAIAKQIEPFLLSEITYPSPLFQKRYETLIGLNRIKRHVLTSLCLLFSETIANEWLRKHHPHADADNLFGKPYPAFVFDGPPGLGKTELARSIGDPLARMLGTQVVSYSISLGLRGETIKPEYLQDFRVWQDAPCGARRPGTFTYR